MGRDGRHPPTDPGRRAAVGWPPPPAAGGVVPGDPQYQVQQVTVRCPVTQEPLATGVYLSAVAFASSIFTNVRVRCPHCAGEHRWSSADAYLVALPNGTPPAEAFGRHLPSTALKLPPRPRAA